jgi:hypothetical protein
VGAHLQDQWLTNAVYNINFTPISLAPSYNAKPLSGSLTAAQIFGDDYDTVVAQLYKDIPGYARILSEASNGAISVAAQKEILRLRASLFFDKKVAIGALTFGIFGGNCWVTLPLSTGSVHVSGSSSPLSSQLRVRMQKANVAFYHSHPPTPQNQP